MIRVLHIIDSLDLGGAQTVVLQIAQRLDRSRFAMEVASMHGRGLYAEKLEREGIAVHCLSSSKYLPLYVPNFLRLLSAGNFDVLHFHLFGSNWIAKPLAAWAGKHALIAHDHCNDLYRSGKPLHIAIDRWANGYARKILAVSRTTADFLTQVEKIPQEKVVYLANGMDTAQFQPATAQTRAENRKRLGIAEEAFVVGGIGRFHPQKNFSLFLDIADRLRSDGGLHFVLAGSGPEESLLREKTRTLGLEGRVTFAGLVAEMPGFYSTLDALLLPSRYEGMPMTVLEAMASGIPVIGSDLDGVREVIRDGENGFLVAADSKEGFAEKLRLLKENPVLHREFAERARAHILQHFDIGSTVSQIEALYREVMPTA